MDNKFSFSKTNEISTYNYFQLSKTHSFSTHNTIFSLSNPRLTLPFISFLVFPFASPIKSV